MKFVPSLPPPRITGVGGRLMVNRLTPVKAAKPVQPRSLPPLVVQHQHEYHSERRHDPHLDGDRRIACRRILHLPVLEELRSGTDRRHHSQRENDQSDHIDIEA